MRAAYITEFAEKDNIRVGELSDPHPAENEVCIAVAYAGVNPVDGKIAKGKFHFMPHEFPMILGWEAAGTIHSIGKKVEKFKKGERVFTYCRKPVFQYGAWAEYLVFEAEHVAPLPENLSFEEAAGVPLAGLTAWQALFEKLHIQPGQTLLIHAGAGGVGGFAIQWAKHHRVHVITTASSEKRNYVKAFGADEIIDYQKHSFVEEIRKTHPKGIDAVFDTVGGDTYTQSFETLKPGGRIVSILEQPNTELANQKNVHAEFLFVYPDGKSLKQIASLFEKGIAKPPKIKIFGLSQAAEAIEAIRSGHTTGKIVLRI